MMSLKIGAIIAAAFIAGAFVASPELRAYAANTVGSSDIIDESIQSIDIKNGQVKSLDLASNAVTSTKLKDGEVKLADLGSNSVDSSRIKDGTIQAKDLSSTFIKHKVLLNDAVGNAAGWNPNNAAYVFTITDTDIDLGKSTVIVNIEQNAITPCTAGFHLNTEDVFTITCETDKLGPANNAKLHYTIINTS